MNIRVIPYCLFKAVQELSGRCNAPSGTATADRTGKRFDFEQPFGLGLSAAGDIAKQMVVWTI